MKKSIMILLISLTLVGCSNNQPNTVPSSPDMDTNVIKDSLSAEEDTASDSDSLKEQGMTHEYFCDKFQLTVDDKQYDLTALIPELSSVSELYPITDDQLYILGRIDENYNALIIYDFSKGEFIFSEQGNTMCWVQDKFETVRYLKDNVVYDISGNVIYQPEDSKLITMIEYVAEDFKVTVADANYENEEELWM